jgi:hypothetical protein
MSVADRSARAALQSRGPQLTRALSLESHRAKRESHPQERARASERLDRVQVGQDGTGVGGLAAARAAVCVCAKV